LSGKLVLLATAVTSLFALIVVGAYVTAAGYGGACGSDVPADWPFFCLGQLLPPSQVGPMVEYAHRILAALSALLLFAATGLYWRDSNAPNPTRRALGVASLLLIIQILLGGLVIAGGLSEVLVSLHQATAILVFGFAVAALATSGD